MLHMDETTARQLLHVNRRFYDTFAEAFSDSRAASEPGFERILANIAPGDSVLDLGCGQGRLALLLPEGCTYIGIDYAAEMLRVARGAADGQSRVEARFFTADLVNDAWESKISSDVDWVILRAVLHHIPGYGNRLSLVRRAAGVLTATGTLAIANWQFVKIPRLMRRALPWCEIGLSESNVDPGDYLLDWQRNGHGVRYVHWVDEAETRRLAQDADLRVDELFFADGHTGDLTLYALLSPQDGTTR